MTIHHRWIEVTVDGPAQGLDRSRQDAHGKRFDSPKNEANKKRIAHIFREQAFAEGITLPLHPGQIGYTVIICVNVAIPKKFAKNYRDRIKEGSVRPLKTPDVDNVAKLYLDALVQGGIIEDDRNVTQLSVSRWYSETGYTTCSVGFHCAPLGREEGEEENED